MAEQQDGLHALPLEAWVEVCKWLEPSSQARAAATCKQLRKAASVVPLGAVNAHIAASSVSSLTQWLQSNGNRITSLHISAHLHSLAAKQALWSALSSSAARQLVHLHLDMPLLPEDQVAIVDTICSSAPLLTSLSLHYQRPLSHAKKCNVTCFCTHGSSTLWAAAQQLRALRLTGACVCNSSSVMQLSKLTALQVSCCNSTTADADLAEVLQALPDLQELSYVSSKQAVLTQAVADALAGHSSLKLLELHNFFVAGAATSSPAAGLAAGLAAASTAAVLSASLQRLQGLRLVNCSGAAALLAQIAAVSPVVMEGQQQLQQLGVVRGVRDSFMPAIFSVPLTDSDSDSDSDSESDSDDSSGENNDGSFVTAGGCRNSNVYHSGETQIAASEGFCVTTGPACFPALALQHGRTSSSENSSLSVSAKQFKKLTGIAPIAMLHMLTELDLSGYGLHSIAPLCGLTHLQSLSLGPAAGEVGRSQSVNCIDNTGLAGIDQLQQLQYLDLSHNLLQWESMLTLQGLTNLTYFSLAGNNLGSHSSVGSSSSDNTVTRRDCSMRLLCCNSCGGMLAGGCHCAATSCSTSAAWTFPPKLRQLDVNGCSLSSLPGVSALSSLTSLAAGTALCKRGKSMWTKAANKLCPSSVAQLSVLTKLQELVVAAHVPAECYAGFRALGLLTRLVVEDPNGTVGLFSKAAGGSRNSNSSSASCCFPDLLELGVTLHSLGTAAVLDCFASSCKSLKALTVHQDSICCNSSMESLPPRSRSCNITTNSSSSNVGCGCSWFVPGLLHLTGLTRLEMSPPHDLRLLAGLTKLRHLKLLGCEEGLKPEQLPGWGLEGCSVASCCPRDYYRPAAVLAAAAWTSRGASAAAGVPSVGTLSSPRSFPMRFSQMRSGVRTVHDQELLGLGALSRLEHLELQNVSCSDEAVDQLQVLLPCTRISI